MAHQVNKCRCGRTKHWPHNAKVGDTWACRKCGTVSTLVPPGTPGADNSGIKIPSWGHKAKRKTGRPRRSVRPRRAAPMPPRNYSRPKQAKGSGGLSAGIVLGLAGLAALAGLTRK